MAKGQGASIAYIAIGSNLGDRRALCREALHQMETQTVKIRKVSSLYETEPMEYQEQNWFYNAVVEIETTFTPRQLLKHCQKIENRLGKKLKIPKGPRTIDLDLLFYNQEVSKDPKLTLPHPAIAVRPFVLIPLAEIAPDLIHPTLQQTARDLLSRLTTSCKVEKKWGPGWGVRNR